MGQSSASGGKKERWRELCEQALTETDPKEMLELTEEVIRLLAEEEAHTSDLGVRLIA
jgi:hypothetical protein